MDGSGFKEYPPLPKSELEKIARGSMVMVFDPECDLWYWVIIEKRLEDNCLVGRIDQHCIIGPTLRHGGKIAFHEDNILYIWPAKVNPIFDKRSFRIASSILSGNAGAKALKRASDRIASSG